MVVNVKLAMSISDSEGEEGCVFGCWLAPRELGLWKVAWSWSSQGRGPLAGVIWQLTIFSDIYLMHMSISYPFKRLQTCASLAICSCHRVNEFGKPLSLRMRRAASLTKTRGSDQPTNHMLSRAGMSYPHFQGSFRPVGCNTRPHHLLRLLLSEAESRRLCCTMQLWDSETAQALHLEAGKSSPNWPRACMHATTML